MQRFEFKVVPAPKKGEKAKGAKTTPDRFAVAMMTLMNKLGADGWDYVRADTLPCDERVGLTGSKTSFQNMLVFRRVLKEAIPEAVAMIETRIEPTFPPMTAPAYEEPEETDPVLRDAPEPEYVPERVGS